MPEIVIDFRARLQKLRQDLKAVQSEASALPTRELAEREERLREQVQQTRRRQRRQQELRYELQEAKRLEEAKDRQQQEAAARRARRDRAAFQRNMMFGVLPLMTGGTSPLAMFASARQIFQALTTTQAGAGMLQGLRNRGGRLTAGMSDNRLAAIAAAGITTAAAALGAAFLGLRKVVHDTTQSYENARRIYARTLTSGGMSAGYIVQRQALARTLGVGEEEVYRFGAAVRYLDEKLRLASSTIAVNNARLTESAWKTQILAHDWEALMSNMAATFANVKDGIVQALDEMAKKALKFSEKMKLWEEANQFAINYGATHKGADVAVIRDKNGMPSGFANMNNNRMMPELWAEFMKQRGTSNIPKPSVDYNRLPVSGFERMGLVVGGTGASDNARKTADNTHRIAQLLEHAITKGTLLPVGDSQLNQPARSGTPLPAQLPNGGRGGAFYIPRAGSPSPLDPNAPKNQAQP